MIQVLKNKKGVTLVELLAVIVIMGIIAAIAVPAIGGLIDNSKERAAETEYANILDAARLYAQSENPATNFSISDLITKDYITTTDAVTNLGANNVAVFDSEGALLGTVTTFTINNLVIDVSTGKVS